ncbi:MAG: hypothetical protein M1840_004368 [Geoglossum simile]|nr:MAG: hypothetical protein M1840_004368 [Geoglossum simile]
MEDIKMAWLEEEVQILRRDNTAGKKKRTHDEVVDDSAPPTKHSSIIVDIRPIKPSIYEGKLMNSLKEDIRQCELAFCIRGEECVKDVDKMLYVAQFLDVEPAKAFEHLESVNSQDKTSWQEYKMFLKDLAQDPVTRASTMVEWYNTACQWPSQTVTQFVNYLDEIESEMSPYSELQRHRHLLAKLLL